jgi:hypothetical protein
VKGCEGVTERPWVTWKGLKILKYRYSYLFTTCWSFTPSTPQRSRAHQLSNTVYHLQPVPSGNTSGLNTCDYQPDCSTVHFWSTVPSLVHHTHTQGNIPHFPPQVPFNTPLTDFQSNCGITTDIHGQIRLSIPYFRTFYRHNYHCSLSTRTFKGNTQTRWTPIEILSLGQRQKVYHRIPMREDLWRERWRTPSTTHH